MLSPSSNPSSEPKLMVLGSYVIKYSFNIISSGLAEYSSGHIGHTSLAWILILIFHSRDHAGKHFDANDDNSISLILKIIRNNYTQI